SKPLLCILTVSTSPLLSPLLSNRAMENESLIAQMEDFEASLGKQFTLVSCLEHSDAALKPKLLFTRSKVFVKATADNKDGMPGFLSVIETDRHGSVVINLIGGESLPAFYFHDDGLASKGKAPPGVDKKCCNVWSIW
ncbi:hypothetical protein BGZ70_002639, partial [Mortierella alpina]